MHILKDLQNNFVEKFEFLLSFKRLQRDVQNFAKIVKKDTIRITIAAAFGAKLCNLLVGATTTTTAGQSFGEKALCFTLTLLKFGKEFIKKS